jgi:hypothetical protein
VVRFKEIAEGLPFVWRFLIEVWTLAPGHFILWALLSIYESLSGAISLMVTAQILQTVRPTRILDKEVTDLMVSDAKYYFEWKGGYEGGPDCPGYQIPSWIIAGSTPINIVRPNVLFDLQD